MKYNSLIASCLLLAQTNALILAVGIDEHGVRWIENLNDLDHFISTGELHSDTLHKMETLKKINHDVWLEKKLLLELNDAVDKAKQAISTATSRDQQRLKSVLYEEAVKNRDLFKDQLSERIRNAKQTRNDVVDKLKYTYVGVQKGGGWTIYLKDPNILIQRYFPEGFHF